MAAPEHRTVPPRWKKLGARAVRSVEDHRDNMGKSTVEAGDITKFQYGYVEMFKKQWDPPTPIWET